MTFTNPNNPQNTKRKAQSAKRKAQSAKRKNKLFVALISCSMLLFANTIELKAQTSPNIVPTNGNAGFGTTTPTEKVEINGKIKVTDKAIFKDDVIIDNDLKIKSLEDLTGTVNRVLGINPNGKLIAPNGLLLNNNGYKLDVIGNLKVGGKINVNYITVNDTAYLKTIVTNRIKSFNGDSLIHFGDSSVIINHVNNRIYASASPQQPIGGGTFYRGFSIGATNNSLALNSFSMGNYLTTKQGTYGNIILGSGIANNGSGGGDTKAKSSSSSTTFINDKSHCLMVGFLSTQPTFYVGPNTDTKDNNGYGYVGIATKNPIARLDVNGGPLWTTNGWSKAIKISNGNAIEMQGSEVKWGMGTASDDNWYLFNTKTEEQTDAAHYVMTADYNGNVTMYGNLNVVGNITGGSLSSSGAGWLVTGNTSGQTKFIGTTDWSPLIFKTNGQEKMRIAEDGKITVNTVLTVNDYVSIGTHNVNLAYKLGVCGVIGAKEVVVETGTWCDFVFDENYNLPSFDKRIEQVLKQKHLPNMPTAKQVETSGAEVGTTLKALLQNLEEAYLYMNELNKKIEALEKQNQDLKNK